MAVDLKASGVVHKVYLNQPVVAEVIVREQPEASGWIFHIAGEVQSYDQFAVAEIWK